VPGCSFCGHANPPGASRCELCGQELLVPPSQSMAPPSGATPPGQGPGGPSGQDPLSEFGFQSGSPRGATQELFDARSAAPSRYDVTPVQQNQQSARDSMPPPGWGPRGSTTSWSMPAARGPSPTVVPVGARKVSDRKLVRELRGYLTLAIVLLLAAVGIYIFWQKRANSAEMKITILGTSSEAIAGRLVIRDATGATLYDKNISNEGARCLYYRRADITVRVKKSSAYTFEWADVPSSSVSDSELAAAQYALVLDTRRGTYLTVGAPEATC
jgi:hypothetical protein